MYDIEGKSLLVRYVIWETCRLGIFSLPNLSSLLDNLILVQPFWINWLVLFLFMFTHNALVLILFLAWLIILYPVVEY